MKYKITSGKMKGEIIELEEVKKYPTSEFNGKLLEWGDTSPRRMIWKEAKEWCEGQGGGWLMPTIQELISVIDYSKNNLATSVDGFQSDPYWSATTYAYPDNQYNAWIVSFDDGGVYGDSKAGTFLVRCVRNFTV
jgi:hypothetical protein